MIEIIKKRSYPNRYTGLKGTTMSVKGIFSAVIAGTALLTGLASYSSAVISTKLEQHVSRQNNIDGVQATIIERNNGFFSRSQTYKIILSADYLRQSTDLQGIVQDVELYLRHSFVVYPLYIVSDLTLDFSRGSLPAILKPLGLTEIEHQISLHSNMLFQSNNLELQLAPLTHQVDGLNISYTEIKIESNSDFDFAQGTVLTSLDNLTIGIDNIGRFKVSQLVSEADFDSIEKLMVITSITGAVNNISFSDDIRQVKLTIDQLSSNSNYVIAGSDKVSLKAGINVANIDYKDPTTDYVITDSELSFKIDNIDKAGYLELEKVSRQLHPDPQAVTDALMSLVQAGAQGKISRLNMDINGMNFNGLGDFSLPPYSGTQVNSELNQHVIDNLVFYLELNLSKQYPQIFGQLAPMVEHLIERGYISQDPQGNLSSKLKYANSQLMANNKQVQM
jgi:hypothetical protein